MPITPVELRNCQFARKLRGYDPADVDNLVEETAAELESQISANSKLTAEINTLKERLATYQGIEQSLRDALVTAEQAAKQQQEAAIRDSEIKVKETELECEKLKARCQSEVEEIRKEITDLKQQKARYLAEFRSIVDAHQRILASQADGGAKTTDPDATNSTTD